MKSSRNVLALSILIGTFVVVTTALPVTGTRHLLNLEGAEEDPDDDFVDTGSSAGEDTKNAEAAIKKRTASIAHWEQVPDQDVESSQIWDSESATQRPRHPKHFSKKRATEEAFDSSDDK